MRPLGCCPGPVVILLCYESTDWGPFLSLGGGLSDGSRSWWQAGEPIVKKEWWGKESSSISPTWLFEKILQMNSKFNLYSWRLQWVYFLGRANGLKYLMGRWLCITHSYFKRRMKSKRKWTQKMIRRVIRYPWQHDTFTGFVLWRRPVIQLNNYRWASLRGWQRSDWPEHQWHPLNLIII